MRYVCRLLPYEEFQGSRITARRGSTAGYTERTDLMNRLTGTPHDNEPDWRDRYRRAIFDYNRDLQYTIQLKQDAIARGVTASTCVWVPEPSPGDSGGYRYDHDQPQYRYYRALVPIPRSDRLVCVCVLAVTIARVATVLHLGKTSKSIRDSLEATTEPLEATTES